MNRWHIVAVVAVALWVGAGPAAGQGAGGADLLAGPPGRSSERLLFSADAVPSHTVVTAGQTFHLAVVLSVAPGWVFYSPSPGGGQFAPMPAKIAAEAGMWRAGAMLWPVDRPHPTQIGDATVTTYGYAGKVVAYVPITVPADARPGNREIRVKVSGQVCGETQFQCVPVRADAAATVTVGQSVSANADWTEAASNGPGLRQAGRPPPRRGDLPRHRRRAGEPVEHLGRTGPGGAGGVDPERHALRPARDPHPHPQRGGAGPPVAPAIRDGGVGLCRRHRAAVRRAGGGQRVLHLAAGKELDWGRHFQSVPFRLGMAMVVVAMAANLFGVFTVLVPRRLAELEPLRAKSGAPGLAGHGADDGDPGDPVQLRGAGAGLCLGAAPAAVAGEPGDRAGGRGDGRPARAARGVSRPC